MIGPSSGMTYKSCPMKAHCTRQPNAAPFPSSSKNIIKPYKYIVHPPLRLSMPARRCSYSHPQIFVTTRPLKKQLSDLGVNLAGIEIILRLTARLEALQRELGR